jgi:hypothetical protein
MNDAMDSLRWRVSASPWPVPSKQREAEVRAFDSRAPAATAPRKIPEPAP